PTRTGAILPVGRKSVKSAIRRVRDSGHDRTVLPLFSRRPRASAEPALAQGSRLNGTGLEPWEATAAPARGGQGQGAGQPQEQGAGRLRHHPERVEPEHEVVEAPPLFPGVRPDSVFDPEPQGAGAVIPERREVLVIATIP